MTRLGETILIERGELLNFWRARFELAHPHTGELVVYPGAEWRFQAMKSTCYTGQDDPAVVHDEIRRAADAQLVKGAGRLLVIDLGRWRLRSYGDMLEANRAKFQQNEHLREALLRTGFATLVEHRPDPIWGDAMDGSGKNLQGKVLMQVRAELRERFSGLDDLARSRVLRSVVDDKIDDDPSVFSPERYVRYAEELLLVHRGDSVPARNVIRIAEAAAR